MKLFPVWIGLRYTRANNQQRFLSLLSWLSLFGMMLGVAALIIVMSVMNGFQQELQQRLLSVIPDIVLEHERAEPFSLETLPPLSKALTAAVNNKHLVMNPFVGGDALLQSFQNAQAVQLKGVSHQPSSELRMVRGAWVMSDAVTASQYKIVIGEVLAARLQLNVGDKVTLAVPLITVTPFGAKPRMKRFVVTGIFSSGSDMDAKMAFIPLSAARKLYKLNTTDVHGIELRGQRAELSAPSPNDSLKLAAELNQQFAGAFNTLSIKAYAWQYKHQALYKAIKMEQVMVAFMLCLVVGVAAFNLIALLTMMVASKRSDVAVLQMMGMSPYQSMLIFLTQGMTLALLSTFVGTILGVLVANNISTIVQQLESVLGIYIFDPSVFYITGLPSDLQLQDVAMTVLFTLILSAIFCAYPAWRASRIKAVEALSYY